MDISPKQYSSPFNIAVFAAGLGFFVDAFDLLLFNVIRIPSLKSLGFSGEALTHAGESLLAIQMAGMIIGGIVSGILADRKGRATVLFASILLYSIANLANASVNDFTTYAIVRFLAGVGLAGELGAGIALVGEKMTASNRGLGTIMVATLGGLGSIAAGLIGDILPWRTAYIVAGLAGFMLLFIRMKSLETSLFKESIKRKDIQHGNFFMLFKPKERLNRFIKSVLIGVPIWYCVGMLISFMPDLALQTGNIPVKLGTCFILFQVGITTGDLSSGLLSQWFKNRLKVMAFYMLIALVACAFWFLNFMYWDMAISTVLLSFLMGYGCGYLSVFVTATSEQFGTNLRVTATSSVTNFMRGSVSILIPLHILLRNYFTLTLSISLIIIGLLVWSLAFYAVLSSKETFGKDLNFVEE
jgi:MFS family permease